MDLTGIGFVCEALTDTESLNDLRALKLAGGCIDSRVTRLYSLSPGIALDAVGAKLLFDALAHPYGPKDLTMLDLESSPFQFVEAKTHNNVYVRGSSLWTDNKIGDAGALHIHEALTNPEMGPNHLTHLDLECRNLPHLISVSISIVVVVHGGGGSFCRQ